MAVAAAARWRARQRRADGVPLFLEAIAEVRTLPIGPIRSIVAGLAAGGLASRRRSGRAPSRSPPGRCRWADDVASRWAAPRQRVRPGARHERPARRQHAPGGARADACAPAAIGGSPAGLTAHPASARCPTSRVRKRSDCVARGHPRCAGRCHPITPRRTPPIDVRRALGNGPYAYTRYRCVLQM